jgi:hypothetical protein
MMRYFFHVEGVVHSGDSEGLELPAGEEAVRAEAIGAARQILSEGALAGRDRTDWTMLVTDATGQTILRLPLSEALRKG